MELSALRRLVTTALCVTSALGASRLVAEDAAAPSFDPPSGPYPTGLREFTWTDENRPETFTRDPGDRRRLIVRITYPAAAAKSAERAPYVLDAAEFGESASVFLPGTRVRTHSALGAPPAPGRERFPVLLFSHGYGWPRFSSHFLCESMASHGYVVVAVNHSGANPSVRFPDGATFAMDENAPPEPTGDGERDALAFWDYLTARHVPVWEGDLAFVLDRVEGLNLAGPFADRLDLGRVGAAGWSFGGAMSVNATRVDRRVRAAADLDGQLFGPMIESGTNRPVLFLHGKLDAADEGPKEIIARLRAIVDSRLASFKERSTSRVYDLTLRGAQHGSFSDLVLFTTERLPGEIDPRRAHAIVRDYVLAFFERHLRGIESPLLEGPSEAYPEVAYEARTAGTK